jgi:choice-of-anchor B domain-containing protein
VRIFTVLLFVFIAQTELQSQTICENNFAGGIYPCDGYDLFFYFPLEEIGGGEKGNDCCGWTHEPSGREFAVFCRSNGTAFVEITNPLQPLYLSELPTETEESIWRDVKVVGDYALIVSEADEHGMQVFDLNGLTSIDPDVINTPIVMEASAHYSGFGSCHNIAVNEDSQDAFAVGAYKWLDNLNSV